VRFRRKSDPGSQDGGGEPSAPDGSAEPAASPAEEPRRGPLDSSEVHDDVERVDLGSLRIAPLPEREVRLQVDEKSGGVQAVMIMGPDGALEVRAFAAPRHSELWEEIRPRIAAETAQAGGTTEEREGPYGTELMCRRPAQTSDGRTGTQASRVVGVNGDRWLLRATFVGKPAVEPGATPEWDDTLAAIVVHRGSEAMPAGEALPLEVPPQARRVG
jgi:hypothetical protein